MREKCRLSRFRKNPRRTTGKLVEQRGRNREEAKRPAAAWFASPFWDAFMMEAFYRRILAGEPPHRGSALFGNKDE